jgi:sugar phosphate isomerase/epimerase
MPTVSVMTMAFEGFLENGTWTDTTLLHAVKAAGFDGVELPSSRFLAHPTLVETYRAQLQESGLRVTCIDAICDFVSRDAAERAKAVAVLCAGVDLAAALGAPLVLAAGSRLPPEVSPEEGRRMIVEGLQACLDAAEQAGVTLAIENFGIEPALQCAVEDCLEVLEAVPGLAFVFDTGNFLFCGEDPLNNFQRLLRYTRHVHVKDWVKSDEPQIADVAGAPLGTGLVPNEGLVRRFLHWGVDSFSLEVGAPGDRYEAARRDLATLLEWLPPR